MERVPHMDYTYNGSNYKVLKTKREHLEATERKSMFTFDLQLFGGGKNQGGATYHQLAPKKSNSTRANGLINRTNQAPTLCKADRALNNVVAPISANVANAYWGSTKTTKCTSSVAKPSSYDYGAEKPN